MTRVIGLIGRIASGKTIVAEYLVNERGAKYYRFSDVLRDVLARLHKPDTRENLQELGLLLRRSFGDGILADVLREDIAGEKSALTVVDGIRYAEEFDMVKAVGGRIFFVTSPQKVRYERACRRGTRGEAEKTLEEFCESEERHTEKMIDALGARSDVIIENSGTIGDLREKVKAALTER